MFVLYCFDISLGLTQLRLGDHLVLGLINRIIRKTLCRLYSSTTSVNGTKNAQLLLPSLFQHLLGFRRNRTRILEFRSTLQSNYHIGVLRFGCDVQLGCLFESQCNFLIQIPIYVQLPAFQSSRTPFANHLSIMAQ